MSFDVNEQLNQYLDNWKNETEVTNVVPILSKISDLIERETEVYYKMDPDPFDDRHPSRSKPNCSLGPLLKNLFKNDDFMNKLVNDYLMNRDNKELQIASCRLVLDILPGLETSVVFNDTEGLLERLLNWARGAEEPLQSYATGLLAAAMDVQDIAAHSKEQNSQLMPIMLQKLKGLIQISINESNNIEKEDFVHSSPFKRRRISSPSNDCSNSSWAEMEPFMIGSAKIFPLTSEISQRFIYQYLTSLGVYQDLLSFVFEHNVLAMILNTIDLNKNGDVRLAFDALKYLASLLCHKKFALEFVNVDGIQSLLKVYRQSVASNGVSYCLNCIAYHDDVMEKICFLPKKFLEELVSYALFLIETSHDSSRSNAMIFFSLTFSYRLILDQFDIQDGLRKVLNEISMIDLFSSNANYTEDEIFTKRQYAKHVCFALKRYFEAHLIMKTQQIIRSNSHSGSNIQNWARLTNINVPHYKTINYDYDLYMEHVDALLHLMPLACRWTPVDVLIKFGAAKLLIQYISLSYDWNFTGKADAVRSALDVLVVCSVMAKFQATLCDTLIIDEGHSTAGMRIILAAASGEIVNDPDCQRSALNVIINCVCGPINRIGGSISRMSVGSAKKKSFRCGEDILNKMWNCVRFNNGIMSLLSLLTVKTPITDADSIRTLSCKALCGLARSETVRQMIGKLSLFTSGQIQTLMKEPILQDKRNEHIKFVKYCLELVASVTGSPVETNNMEQSVGNLNKAEVITQTKIVFNEKELLQLIHKHLVGKGLSKTAKTLLEEADISNFASNHPKSGSFSKFNTPPRALSRVSRQISILSQNQSFSASSPQLNNTTSSSLVPMTPSGLNIPIRINRTSRHRPNGSSGSSISNRRQSFHFSSPMTKRRSDFITSSVISLDSIVIEYLRKQHALCKNPVVTCPPFDLFKPHRCPDPKNRRIASVNITSRLQNRQAFPPSGGMYGSKMDRKFIYSRFRPYRSLRAFDPTNFLCSAFSYSGNLLYVGTDSGELHVFNYISTDAQMQNSFPCYDSVVSSIEPSWDGKLLLTSSFWDPPNSILWSITETSLEQKYSFLHDNHVEFGKATQDKALGTAEFAAHLYDLGSGNLLRTFDDENYANRYVKNIATFHPSDHLVLNDGVLWDVRAETPIHKFDKFNQDINGIFHPNGQEIISNSEIWDIKTFKLLKTVPALNQSHIKFNRRGDVLYGVYEDDTVDEFDEKLPFSSSFRTFDGRDYSSIATIDVKRSITSLAIDPSDSYIAIIENQCNRDNSIYSQDKVARIYEIGRCREEDDEERDDDEDEGDEESGDSFDDDDLLGDDFNGSSSDMSGMSDELSDIDTDDDFDSDSESSSSSSSSSGDEDEVYYQLNRSG